MTQVLPVDMPLPDLGPKSGPVRKVTSDSDQEAGHSFRRLLDRHAETASAEEGRADEPAGPDAPADDDAEEPTEDALLAMALAAMPSALEQFLAPSAPETPPVNVVKVKSDAAVAIKALGAASAAVPQQAAVAAALLAGSSAASLSAVDPSSAVPATPAIPPSAVGQVPDPVAGLPPELEQLARAMAGSPPEPAPSLAAASGNAAPNPLPKVSDPSAMALVATQQAELAKAASGDAPVESHVIAPAQPAPAPLSPVKKAGEAAAASADIDAQRPAALAAFDALTAPGLLADSPREVANHYHRVGDAVQRAASDGTMSPAGQVSLRVVHGLAEGRRAIQVQLHPAELGSIDVKMHWQGERLTAQFVVDRPETLELLQRDARALERALGSAGIDLADSGLSFSLKDQGGWQQDRLVPGAGAAEATILGEAQEIAADEPLGQIVRDGIVSIRV